MNENPNNLTSRREFIKNTGKIAAASALAGVAIPHVHAAESNTLQVALVGCGGRGTDAAGNALSVKGGGTKLVAMADVFPERLREKHAAITRQFAAKVEVPEDRRFLGFDAYKKAMDCLKPGDIVILTTPPAFRWVHFTYAIEKGLNVFMEKPVTVDGPTSKRMFELAGKAKAKNLKVGVGLNSHADFEVLGLGLSGKLKHAFACRPVHGHGFFHEHIEAFLNRVGEMHPTKRWRRCQDHNVTWFQAVHRLLVSVEAEKSPVLGYLHFCGKLPRDCRVLFTEALWKHVGHGDELGASALDRQRISRGIRAASTATDEGDLQGIAFRSVNVRNSDSRQGRGRSNFPGVFDEFAT